MSRAVILAAFVVVAPTRALPWGCEGHQTIALIAARHLSRAVRLRVDGILAGAPVDPTLRRSCPAPSLGRLPDVSTWADDVRGVRPETASWHFVDIPRGTSGTHLAGFCATRRGCLVQAIEEQLAVLRDAAADRRVRAEAIMYVVHLVGDLHQPLHCATNGDRGGNCVPVEFFGERPRRFIGPGHPASHEDYAPNLHRVWDTDLPRRRMAGLPVRTYARRLDEHFAARAAGWQAAGVDVAAWARETHRVAEAAAYGRLPRPIPVEPDATILHCRDGEHVARRMLALHERVAAPYEAATGPVLDEQLARAGVRLAMVLGAALR